MIIFHGRFQPFHLGHEIGLRYLLENYDKPVVVGIINPDPGYVLEGDDANWIRFSPERNPFSYWERYNFIYSSIKKFPHYQISLLE